MPDPVPLSRVKDLLAEEAAHRTLPREAALALQHAELFVRLSSEQTDKLISEGVLIIVATIRFDVKYAHEPAVVQGVNVSIN